jgi:hypothetical protein
MRHMQVLCKFCCGYVNTGDDDAVSGRKSREADDGRGIIKVATRKP